MANEHGARVLAHPAYRDAAKTIAARIQQRNTERWNHATARLLANRITQPQQPPRDTPARSALFLAPALNNLVHMTH